MDIVDKLNTTPSKVPVDIDKYLRRRGDIYELLGMMGATINDVVKNTNNGIDAINDDLEDSMELQEELTASETTRQTNESTRQSNEDIRKANEAARQTAEGVRVTNENARQIAESARTTAFNESQTQRTNTFNASEASREATFNSKEAQRDAAIASVTEMSSKVDTLRSDVDELEPKVGDLESKTNELYKYDVAEEDYDDTAFSNVGFINNDSSATVSETAGFSYTDAISINPKDIVKIEVNALFGNGYGGGVMFFRGNTKVGSICSISGVSYTTNTVRTIRREDIPSTANAIKVTRIDNEGAYIKIYTKGTCSGIVIEHGERIDSIESKIVDIENILNDYEIIDYSAFVTIYEGKKYTNGVLTNNTSYNATSITLLDRSNNIWVSNAYTGYIHFFDESKAYISSVAAYQDKYVYASDFPENAKYVAFDFYNSSYGYSWHTSKYNERNTPIYRYFGCDILKKKDSRPVVNIYNADTQATIMRKMVAAMEARDCDVYWENGTYTFDELFTFMYETISMRNYYEIPIGNGCRYYLNGATIIANSTDMIPAGDTGVCDLFSTNTTHKAGDVEMHDAYIYTTGLTYAIHEDSGDGDASYIRRYKNIYIDHTAATIGSIAKPMGCGTSSGYTKIIVEDCNLKTNNNYDLSVHGAYNKTNVCKCEIKMVNCQLSKTLSLDNVGSNQTAIATIVNCYLTKEIYKSAASWEIVKSGNTFDIDNNIIIPKSIKVDGVLDVVDTSADVKVTNTDGSKTGLKNVASQVAQVATNVGGLENTTTDMFNTFAKMEVDTPSAQTWTGTRTTAGGEAIKDGVAYLDKVKGNTIVWNQWQDKSFNANGYATMQVDGNEFSITLTADATTNYSGYITTASNVNCVVGHKYLLTCETSVPRSTSFRIDTNGTFNTLKKDITTINTWAGISFIETCLSTKHRFSYYPSEKIDGYLAGDTYKVRNCMCIDLTAMFGAGNEPTSVDDFKALFPNDYYAYNEGQLLSFNGTEIESKDASGNNANSYPLAISSIKDSTGAVLFPNGLCSAGSVCDEITPTKAIKRIGYVDLGSLDWALNGDVSSTITQYITRSITDLKPISEKSVLFSNMEHIMEISTVGGLLRINSDIYHSISNFTTAMSGVFLYYELATPIEVALPLKANYYKVYNNGTETCKPINGEAPTTTPIKAEIGYRTDYETALAALATAAGV